MRDLKALKYTCHGDTTNVDIVNNQRYSVADDNLMIEGTSKTSYDNNRSNEDSYFEVSSNSTRLKQVCEYCNKIFVNVSKHHNKCKKNPVNNHNSEKISNCLSLADISNNTNNMMSFNYELCSEKKKDIRRGRSICKSLVRDGSNTGESSITSSGYNLCKVQSNRKKSKQLCEFCSKYFVKISKHHNYSRKNPANKFSLGLHKRSLLAISPCTTNRHLMSIDRNVSMCSDQNDVSHGRSIKRRSIRKRLKTSKGINHNNLNACSSASGNSSKERMKRRRNDVCYKERIKICRNDVCYSRKIMKRKEKRQALRGSDGDKDSVDDDVANKDNISEVNRIDGKRLNYYEMITKKDIGIIEKN